MDYEKAYKDLMRDIDIAIKGQTEIKTKYIFQKLKVHNRMSKDEEIIRDIIYLLITSCEADRCYPHLLAWLKEQKEQKELNLVKILKHYPKETELYSPLYGKLWLAEVDETNEIITCYKHPLEKDDIRAILEQEDTVSFYSNGTTGLPDFEVSKDCMLFLYDTKKQCEQKSAEWGELQADFRNINEAFEDGKKEVIDNPERYDLCKPVEWSEEDKRILKGITGLIHHNQHYGVSNKEMLTWLTNRLEPLCLQQEQPEVDFEKVARHIYESWMGSKKDDFLRDMGELGKVLNARKEESK